MVLIEKKKKTKLWFFQWSCMVVRVKTVKKAECRRIDAFELCCWRRLLRVPWTARRSNQSILKETVLTIHWKDWCWSWNSNTLATWSEVLTHWKTDGWMASSTWWTWVCASSWSWWWTGKPGMLESMGWQGVSYNWATELTELNIPLYVYTTFGFSIHPLKDSWVSFTFGLL